MFDYLTARHPSRGNQSLNVGDMGDGWAPSQLQLDADFMRTTLPYANRVADFEA